MQTLAHTPRWVRLLAFLLRPWLHRVPMPLEALDAIRAAGNGGKIVLLMRNPSWIDYLVWWSISRRAKLPPPNTIFGMGPRERDGDQPGVPSGSLVFLKNTQETGFDPIERLIREVRASEGRSRVHLFPVSFLWSLKPRSMERSLFEIVFGPKESAKSWRKTIWLMRGASSVRVTVADEVKLHEFVAEHPGEGDDVLSRKVRLSVRYHLAREERTILGPRLVPRRRLLDRALKDAALQGAIQEVAHGSGRSVGETQRAAEMILDEIAADYQWSYIRFLELTLNKVVWRRMYEDFQIDLDGLERVREAAKDGPVVLIPSHKSHMDYLIISYFFKINNIPPPHIAAGENLSFFPLGHIFRRCGAFFIRRSFLGDTLYETALQTYIKVLLKENYNIEFFIEGTRSRSGKVLPPKFGMLSMVIEAAQQMTANEVNVVPVSIDYESLVEESAMVREAQGGEKKGESVGGLIKARRSLKKQYGTVYLKFGESVKLNDMLEGLHDADQLDRAKRVAYDVTHRIQQTVTVTSTALVSTAICVHHKRGIRRETLLERIGLLTRTVQRHGAGLASDFLFGTLDPERALSLLIQNGVVRLIEIQGEKVYTVDDAKRMALDYYKNNIIQFMVNTSFACLAFRVCRDDTFDSLWSGYCDLHTIFLEEFHRLYDPPTKDELRRELDWLAEEGFLTEEDGRWRVLEPVPVMAFENVTRNFLESAYIAVLALLESRPRDASKELKEWMKLTMEMGDLLYAKGDVWRIESRSKVNLQNALTSFRHNGLLTAHAPEGTRKGRRSLYRLNPDRIDDLERMQQTLGRILVEVQLN